MYQTYRVELAICVYRHLPTFLSSFSYVPDLLGWVGYLWLVEKIGVPGENHRPVASRWQTLSHNVVSSTPRSCICILGVSILPLSTVLIFLIWNCSDSMVFVLFHFINVVKYSSRFLCVVSCKIQTIVISK